MELYMRRCVALALGVVSISALDFGQGLTKSEYARGSLRDFAEQARAEGRSHLTVISIAEQLEGSLRDFLTAFPLLDLKVEPGELRATVGQVGIYTWYRASDLRALSSDGS